MHEQVNIDQKSLCKYKTTLIYNCYRLNGCVPPQFMCWNLIPIVMGFEVGPLGGDEVIRAKNWLMGFTHLWKKGPTECIPGLMGKVEE